MSPASLHSKILHDELLLSCSYLWTWDSICKYLLYLSTSSLSLTIGQTDESLWQMMDILRVLEASIGYYWSDTRQPTFKDYAVPPLWEICYHSKEHRGPHVLQVDNRLVLCTTEYFQHLVEGLEHKVLAKYKIVEWMDEWIDEWINTSKHLHKLVLVLVHLGHLEQLKCRFFLTKYTQTHIQTHRPGKWLYNLTFLYLHK